jgi:hypothetical protein
MVSFGYAARTPASWLAGLDTVVFDDMRDLPRLPTTTAGLINGETKVGRGDGRARHARRHGPQVARELQLYAS